MKLTTRAGIARVAETTDASQPCKITRMANPMPRSLAVVLSLLMTGASACAAAQLPEAATVPHLNPRGEVAWRAFLGAEHHRAFALAPGGGWGWSGNAASPEIALREALDTCNRHTAQRCVPYAVDKRVVFERDTWPTLWRPYASAAEAAQARTGIKPGERFPDLRLTTPAGKLWKLSAQRGKVVLLHFWGSWCPSCAHELPQFERLRDAFKQRDDLHFVFTQARESAATSRRWLQRNNLALPLHDSGVRTRQDQQFQLANGRMIADRELATVFPTTYVIDRHGIVVFALRGSARDWMEFEPFLRDLLAHR